MAILTWKYVGFAVILFLAALQNIPDELSEAAAIDGASYWQVQRRITLPLLGPTIRIWAFLSMIGALQLFDLVYIIWGQYIAATAGTSTMATYMVANGRIAGEYGYGNAVAVVLFCISFAAALVYQRFVLRRDTEGAITWGEELMAASAIGAGWVTGARRRQTWGSPTVYLVALLLIGAMLAPVVYIIIGGFRTNAQITTDPAGWPNPWQLDNYLGVLRGKVFWREVVNSTVIAVSTTAGVVTLGLMTSFILARYQFRGRGAMYSLFAAGLMFPLTVAVHTAVHPGQDHRTDEYAARGDPPADRVRHPHDNHRPGPVPASDTGRNPGGRVDRRLQPAGVLLADGAPAIDAGCHHRGHPDLHRQLEQLPAAALHPQPGVDLHAAAWRAGLRIAVLGRHGQGPSVHVPVDDPGVGVLQPVSAPNRRRPDRSRERLTCARDGRIGLVVVVSAWPAVTIMAAQKQRG
jgi:ABC-type sugar transport system permease subunit